MDAIRYVLALSVIIAHFNILCGYNIPWLISSATGVSGFFAMSGFLIFGSYYRQPSISQFLKSRGRRILPPYFFIVLLCAIGFVFISDLGAIEYFSSPQWWKYLVSNILFLNFIEPSLPGVFEGAAFYMSAVNGSLWTMKVEWCLYISVPIVASLLFWINKSGNRNYIGLTFLFIIISSIAYRMLLLQLFDSTGKPIYEILSRQFLGQLAYFYIGACIYFFLDEFLKYKWYVFCMCIIMILMCDIIPFYDIILRPITESCLVLWFSLVGNWGKYISRHDNVSYDMYLFHFPIMQLAVYLEINQLSVIPSFTIVLSIVVILSFLSWNFIGCHFKRKNLR